MLLVYPIVKLNCIAIHTYEYTRKPMSYYMKPYISSSVRYFTI